MDSPTGADIAEIASTIRAHYIAINGNAVHGKNSCEERMAITSTAILTYLLNQTFFEEGLNVRILGVVEPATINRHPTIFYVLADPQHQEFATLCATANLAHLVLFHEVFD